MIQPLDSAQNTSDPAAANMRWIALRDLLLVLAVLVIVKQSLLPITQLYAGPASTLSAMIAATVLLRRRGRRWSDLGFRWPENWLQTLGLTLLAMAFFLVCTQLMALVADRFFEDIGTSDRFSCPAPNLCANF